MAFNGDGPHSKRQRLEESGHRNHEYGGYGDEPRRKREDNNKPNHVLLFTIINPVYPITVEVLHTISAPSGQVQRIVIFKKNGVQAMVEFDTVESATRAKETLHGADIYSGCCTLKIDFAKPTKLNVYKNDAESWDYTTPTLAIKDFISIPSFKGVYETWPTYRDLFKAVIYDSQRLTDVEKLHYLRLSLEGPPAKLISGLPLTGDSLKLSWEMLVDRYENKRLLIQSYLDQLFASSTPVQKNAKALDKLLNTFKKGIKGLQSLGVSQDLGDCVLVYQLSRQLDRQTKEEWETSLGDAREYPRFEKLEQFLTLRARALEMIESTASSGSSARAASTTRRSSTAHHAAAQPARTNTSDGSTEYPCDCCNGTHFVVMCPKFRQLSQGDRQKLVISRRLCFNCLGRHNVRSCKSSRGCKKCTHRHHTMLHEAH
ncbi:heterogeneous nuclear ribonucleoprotein L isoform X3 [Temnothorax americanus]|uniref:heterogeneous nuclear ribonucleoprotein L isoform X3 n=1 Tax=Temnothorax americanus TaxID=1964332 RepID=UPI00406764BF